jgi:hypothetical protein
VLVLAGPASGAPGPAAVAGADGLVEVVDGRLEGQRHGDFALVRPDGFLATRGSAADTGSLVDHLRGLGGTTAADPRVEDAPVAPRPVAERLIGA